MAERELRAFLDRFEGEFAVLLLGEEGEQVRWPARSLPEGAIEGSVLSITIAPDAAASKAAEDAINSLIDRLERGE